MSAFTGTALRGRRTLPAASLPPSFADLEPYFAGRCRRRRRAASCDATAECPISPNSTRRCCPRLPTILSHLNEFPLDAMPDAEVNLFRIGLSFAEVAPFVEQYDRDGDSTAVR